ncbi:hypothetical protein ES708_30330 [subsurface metagenome]
MKQWYQYRSKDRKGNIGALDDIIISIKLPRRLIGGKGDGNKN